MLNPQPAYLPSPPSALLDAPESESQPLRCTVPRPRLQYWTVALTFRHSHWADQRYRVFDAMIDVGLPPLRLNRFGHCGTFCYVMQSDDDPRRYAVQSDTCHDRWCQPCSLERARRIAGHIRLHITGQTVRMLTLTLKHSADPLSDQLDRLHDCLKTLRRSLLWTKRVTGGCCMFEAKWSNVTQAWHPHAHLLLTGRYVHHAALKKLWYKITGDSFIIHIRPCDSDAKAAAYVAKYVGKPWTGDVERSPDLLRQLIVAFEKRRLCHTFGTWRGLKLTEPLDTGSWHRLCSIDELLLRAKRGEQEARTILDSLASKNVPASLLLVHHSPVASRDPPSPNVQLTLETPMTWTERNPP